MCFSYLQENNKIQNKAHRNRIERLFSDTVNKINIFLRCDVSKYWECIPKTDHTLRKNQVENFAFIRFTGKKWTVRICSYLEIVDPFYCDKWSFIYILLTRL